MQAIQIRCPVASHCERQVASSYRVSAKLQANVATLECEYVQTLDATLKVFNQSTVYLGDSPRYSILYQHTHAHTEIQLYLFESY